MIVSRHTKYFLVVIVLLFMPGIVCSQNAQLQIRGSYNASSPGDSISPGLQQVIYGGYLGATAVGGAPLTNVTMTLLADNITKVEDKDYANVTRSSVHWVFPANFTITGSKHSNWYTDNNPIIDVPVTFSRTLNQTTFTQDGYQRVRCNVTFWDLTNVSFVLSEFDSYRKNDVNVTILNDTFETDLPYKPYKGDPFHTNNQFQFTIGNTSEIIIGHPYSFSIVLKIERLNKTKTVVYKPLCGVNLFRTLAQTNFSGANQTISVPEPLPPYVHQASMSVHESVNWSYWSYYERRVLLLENSSVGPVPLNDFSKIGVFRPSTHMFYLDYNANGVWNGASVDRQYNFGLTGDIPVSGDWNKDNKTEIGVFRNSTHMFYLDYNGNGAWSGASVDRQCNFGLTGDIPVSGDWNTDGKTEIGAFRPSTHLFYLDYNGNGVWNGVVTDRQYNFGISGDTPISGDWNLDGRTEIGVFRPSTHLFYLDYNGNGLWNGASVDRQYNFGISGDLPVTGDWNADGRTEIGVFRNSTHLFYLDYSGNGMWNGAVTDKQYNFGITGDKPVSGKW